MNIKALILVFCLFNFHQLAQSQDYNVRVENGYGSGTYKAGQVLYIEAKNTDNRLRFIKWEGDEAILDDPFSSRLSLVMPQKALNFKAVFKQATINLGLPYNGVLHELPGLIEAENYDLGGNEISYKENDSQNTQLNYRQEKQVDLKLEEKELFVDNFQEGEWLNYSIETTKNGSYQFELALNLNKGSSTLELLLDEVPLDQLQVESSDNLNFHLVSSKKVFINKAPHTLRIKCLKANQDNNCGRLNFMRAKIL